MSAKVWHKVMSALTGLLGLVYVVGSLGFAIDGGDDFSSTMERIFFGALGTLLGFSLLAGALILARRPWVGVALIALGAIPVAFFLYWMLVITLPVTAAIVGYAVFWAMRGRGAQSTRQSAAG